MIFSINKFLYIIALVTLTFAACTPDRNDDIQLATDLITPNFTIERLEGDSNRVVIKDLTAGAFQRLWSAPGGTPKNSTKAIDTIFFNKIGSYNITLSVSASNGSGSQFLTKSVDILTDAPLVCSPKLAILTGDCTPEGKCWSLSNAASAVKVGPTYDDFSWYSSPENGLQDQQYDDLFCFTFENLVFQNRNNGASINPWNGYVPQDIDHGLADFIFSEGTGINNRDQIIIPNNQFMGVWDADNVMDVVKLTPTELVLRMKLCSQTGEPNAEGWFELTFVPR